MASSIMSAPVAATNGRSDYPTILFEAWSQHLVRRSADAPTVISTFAGCGGSSLGYSMAGYRELLAVEWDANAVATFRLNFPDVPVFHGDICSLTVEDALRLSGIHAGELDVLDGSPPCQGFSTAGKRNMGDIRNDLFREFVRLLTGLRPRAFVMENVSGMVKGKMRLIFVDILRALRACGYQVSVRLLNAMYFQVPQSRERLIFIGIRDDLGVIPSHPSPYSRPIAGGSALGMMASGLQSRSMSINPWMFGPVATITRTHADYEIRIDGETRRPSLNEIRILASFPGQFSFLGTFSQQWAGIGNSVPPLLMRAIAGHVRASLDGQQHLTGKTATLEPRKEPV